MRVDKYPLLFVVASVIMFNRLIPEVFKQAVNHCIIFAELSPHQARPVLLCYDYFCASAYSELVCNLSLMRQQNNLSMHIQALGVFL